MTEQEASGAFPDVNPPARNATPAGFPPKRRYAEAPFPALRAAPRRCPVGDGRMPGQPRGHHTRPPGSRRARSARRRPAHGDGDLRRHDRDGPARADVQGRKSDRSRRFDPQYVAAVRSQAFRTAGASGHPALYLRLPGRPATGVLSGESANISRHRLNGRQPMSASRANSPSPRGRWWAGSA